MRYARISPIIFLLIAFAATPVFADSVFMKFVGPGGNNSGGVYTYPYNFSINNSPTYTPLVCDAFRYAHFLCLLEARSTTTQLCRPSRKWAALLSFHIVTL